MNHNNARGFTLIELMIVVAIVGIISAIAISFYPNAVLKGRRAEGRAAVADLIQQQERYMTQNNTYLAFAPGQAGVPFKTFSGDSLAAAAYLLSADPCPGSTIKECVQISAAPVKPDPDAGTLIAPTLGPKSCTGTNPAVCWK